MSAAVEAALIRHGLPNRVEGVLKPDPGLITEPGIKNAMAEFRHRATTAVGRVAAGTRDGVAAIFCHGGVIGACVEKAVGDVGLALTDPHYGSMTRIAIEANDQCKLLTYNEIHHIERLAAGREERHEFSR